MRRTSRTFLALGLVATLFLAGCAGGTGGPEPQGNTPTTATPTAGGSTPPSSGTLALYVSDQPSAIGDFQRLDVTVTAVGVHRATAGGATPAGTDTVPNATSTVPANRTAASEDETGSTAGWVVVPVANRTVDLTRLQGENATRVTNATLPAGAYNGVYLDVSNVTGVLAGGSTIPVRLPGDRLRLTKGFALGANQRASFVFDIAVHAAGGSGKYVLRPVIGQSGTDVSIRSVDRTRDRRHTPPGAGPPTHNASTGGGSPGSPNGKRGGPPTSTTG